MATFEELGSDIYLHLLWYVSLLDAFCLSTLNKALYSLSNERTYWNTVLKHAVKTNGAIPYPSHGDVSRLRLHDLKRLAYCSAKLGAMWPSGEHCRLTLRQSFNASSGARSPSRHADHCIVCIVPGTSLVITNSFADGEVACWDRSGKGRLCFLRLGKVTKISPAVNDPGSTLVGVETLQSIQGPDYMDLVVFRINHDREAPVTMDIIWRRGFRLTVSVKCFAINTELVAYSEGLADELVSIRIESLFTGKSVAAQAHIPRGFAWDATLGFIGKDLCLFGLYHWHRFSYMRRWDAQSLPYDTNDAMGDPMAKVILTAHRWPDGFQSRRMEVSTAVFTSTERGIIVSICTGRHERSHPSYPPKTGFHIWKPSHVSSSGEIDGPVCELFVPQEMSLGYAAASNSFKTTPWCSSFLAYTADPPNRRALCLMRYYSADELSDNAPSISMHRLLLPTLAVDFDNFSDIIDMAVDESHGLVLLMKNNGTLFIFSYI